LDKRALLAVVALGTGCLTPFRPTLPMRAVSGDVELALKEVRVAGVQEVVYQTRSIAPHTIYRGRLTVPTRAPCSGGEDAVSIEVDRGTVPPGTLPPGDHELRARFENSANDFVLDLVFDLELEDGTCARAPMVSQSVPMIAVKQFAFVGSIDITATPDLHGLRGLYGGKIGGGGWVGPMLLTAEAGLGSATCVEEVCGRDQQGKFRAGLSVPFSVDARYAFGASNMNRILRVFLVGARYTLATVSLPTLTEGDRDFVTHAAHGVLSLGIGDAVRGPFQRLERAAFMESFVSVGAVLAPGVSNAGVGFSGGFGVRFLLPI
jgi:hypothetical protein